MKKITLVSFALIALSVASCKKSRTCHCTGKTTDVQTQTGTINSNSTTESNEDYTDVLSSTTKAAAKGHRDCMSRAKKSTSSYTSGGTTTTNEVTTDLNCTIN